MSLEQSLHDQIDSVLESGRVIVFMKGVREAPQCGFSGTVVDILDGYLEKYTTVNVLSNPELREGIKQYSSWPTIPQVYLDGEFIGGSDILRELHESGELRQRLGDMVSEIPIPSLRLSEAAAQAVVQAVGQQQSPVYLRLRINSQYYNDLSIDPPTQADIQIPIDSVTIVLDPASARRANGVQIDFIHEGQESGFRIDNPNSPSSVQEISAKQMQAKLADDPAILIVDVRTESERKICQIAGAKLFDDDLLTELSRLSRDTSIIFYCHHGGRSQSVAQQFVGMGFRHIYNLTGGIDAWAREVDSSIARY